MNRNGYIFNPGQAQEAPLTEKILLAVIGSICVLLTFGAASIITILAIACGAGTSPTCAWEDGE